MRISDWSSDVCSSDLIFARDIVLHAGSGGSDLCEIETCRKGATRSGQDNDANVIVVGKQRQCSEECAADRARQRIELFGPVEGQQRDVTTPFDEQRVVGHATLLCCPPQYRSEE